jgi:hypothetical protein
MNIRILVRLLYTIGWAGNLVVDMGNENLKISKIALHTLFPF